MTADQPPWRLALDAALRAVEGQPASRYVQLATVRPDHRPANRTVVFRGFVGADRLLFTTDTRSGKADEIRANPRAALCWSFAETREQFRLLGLAEVNDNPDQVARADLWRGLSVSSRATFTWPQPGAPRSAAEEFLRPTPDAPPPNFGVLTVLPDHVDHLDLRPHPHERTVYRLDGSGWVVERINP